MSAPFLQGSFGNQGQAPIVWGACWGWFKAKELLPPFQKNRLHLALGGKTNYIMKHLGVAVIPLDLS